MVAVPVVATAMVFALLAYWVWMGWDLNHNGTLAVAERQRWAIVLLFFNIFGAALYYREEYRRRH
jgi:hypothetical protein